MKSRQRVGLWLTLVALMMSIIFTGEPGLTEEAWEMVRNISVFQAMVGGFLFGLA